MSQNINRRSFLTGTALALAGVAGAGLAGCASEQPSGGGGPPPPPPTPAYLPESWDYETDIVIVGSGGAGLGAALACYKEDLGECIVIEKAPEEFAGGNTRVCGQIMYIPNDVDGATTYQRNLNGAYDLGEEITRAWAENICENYDWLTDLGADLQETSTCSPEFGEVEGCESCRVYEVDGVLGKASGWNFLKETADDFGVEILYETAATHLVFDPATKEVFGVEATQGDKTIHLKARKGVILGTGSFEADPEMARTYFQLGYPDVRVAGTPYNTGDGIKMCQEVGCDLRNMNCFALQYFGAQVNSDYPNVVRKFSWPADVKDYIYVGPNGKRFMYEEVQTLTKHGHIKRNGVHVYIDLPRPAFAVFGQKCFDAGALFPEPTLGFPYLAGQDAYDNQGMVDAGLFYKADTIEELAEKIGLDPTALANTVATYNQYCANGKDEDFGRGDDFWYDYGGVPKEGETEAAGASDAEFVAIEAFPLEPLEGPFYAFNIYHTLLNAQGGPKRSGLGEVLDVSGNPIPRLYSAGEMGSVYSYKYNGGGNMSDAIAGGRLAARSASALTAWDAEQSA